MLDTYYAVETPEGVAVNLKPAGAGPRAAAWMLDCLIRGGIYFVLSIIIALIPVIGMGILLILIFLIEWFYPVYFEVKHHGQTPGKRRLNLCVVSDNGTPVGWNRAILRNLLRFVDFLPMSYGFGLLSCMFTSKFQRLGDLVAGTLVVYREEAIELGTPQHGNKAAAPPAPLSLAEQRALITFRDRIAGIHPKRQEEIADLLEPLTGHTGAKGVRTLHEYANWLQGERS